MAEAAHLLVVVAGEHVGEMADAEAHLGAERRRQQLARDLGRVDRRRRLEAIVAIAAALRRVLAEMAQQDRAAAAGRLDERRQRVQPLALGRAALRLDLLLDPLAGAGEILRRPEQPGLGRLAVAPGAAGLLVIGLDRTWGSRHGRRGARRACRCPCRRRSSRRSPSPRNGRTPPGCARGPAARARRDRAAPAVRRGRAASAIFSALSRLGA